MNQKLPHLIASCCFALALFVGCANAEDCPDRTERIHAAIVKGGQQGEYEACVKAAKADPDKTALQYGITPESTCASLSLQMIGLAAPKPVTVLGMPLGQQFAIPQCRKRKDGSVDQISRTCWTAAFPDLKEPDQLQQIWYKGDPVIGGIIYPSVYDGILQALTFETAGVKTQDWVMEKLTEKFGEPADCERYPARKSSGEQVLIYKAEWYSADVLIKFDAADHDTADEEKLTLSKGWVSMETFVERKRQADQANKWRREHPPGKL